MALVASGLALGAGLMVGNRLLRPQIAQPFEIAGIYLADAPPLGPFQLTHHSGRPFTAEDLRGRWTFLYFGYSHCPDVCPLSLVHLNRLQRLLAGQGTSEDVAYVFVSVDPRRDTPERLGEFVSYFNPVFQGVTGEPEQLNRLAGPLHVFHQRAAGAGDSEHYAVDHTSTITLIDPTGRPRAIFTPPQDPAKLAADFARIRAVATP